MEADDAQRAYLQASIQKVGEVSPDHLAKNALALANAQSVNIEKAQLLRGQPTSIEEVDVNVSIEVLERLGVAEKRPVDHDLEPESEENV